MYEKIIQYDDENSLGKRSQLTWMDKRGYKFVPQTNKELKIKS